MICIDTDKETEEYAAFLDASTHLYKRVCPFVHPSICWLVGNLFSFLYLQLVSFFSDASTHLYKRVCPFVGPSVRRSVRPSVHHALFFNDAKVAKMV